MELPIVQFYRWLFPPFSQHTARPGLHTGAAMQAHDTVTRG